MTTLLHYPPAAVTSWRDRALPEAGRPAGYGALIDHFDLQVPLPPRLTFIAERHEPEADVSWQVLPRRLKPDDTVEAHLEFALKHEGVFLSILSVLFDVIQPDAVAAFVRESPKGKYTRRTWFLYEWLTGRELDIPDVDGRPAAVDVVDAAQQVALADGALSRRHRVRDNLPGIPAFCPMVRWTDELRSAASANLDLTAREVAGRTHPDVIARAAAFLLLDDSRSSFEIEGERPSRDRAHRWGRAIGEAGSRTITVDELIRLQRIVVGDDRFVETGLRKEGGFIGQRDRRTQNPLPEHISARPDDLESLIQGMLMYDERATFGRVDPVIASAVLAFGFVYVHPFQDGNGRVHRWLIHHVLARAGYNPPELPFPVSAAILRNLSAYRNVLQSYSRPLLDFIEWETTESRTVRVMNETADYYRFFDATAHAEFLYRCVEQTVTEDLPDEIAYLERYDRFAERVQRIVDMPSDTIDLLFRFLDQNEGRLSARARAKEFSKLTSDEVAEIEILFRESLTVNLPGRPLA